MIKQCSCIHEYQDQKYGKGNRLANPLAEGKGYRCTVCGKDIIPRVEKKKDK